MNEAAETLVVDVIPSGFCLLDSWPGFSCHGTNFYQHEQRLAVGTHITARHLNLVNIAHGGFLATFADTAFGLVIKRQCELQQPPVTLNLCLDYIDAVREGDWLEAEVQLLKVGARITNASCLLSARGKPVMRASGVFMMRSHLSPG